ncbi:ubinuclein-1-like isoform X2 [Cicer arietinum]|uniref:Ubinuclein-1-like isoform X2 n=1 Tax=Cicer arietinum TaxID=3827 RepID=A0A1S2Y2I9_CICAR|nr:ubinuclein-1-like isoform X2 [Cicer arietinum]
MMEDNSNFDAAASDSSRPPSSFVKKGDRQIFTVELRQGETTIVSWKKLVKDANKVNSGSFSATEQLPKLNPALEARIAPGQAEIKEQDAPQTNRFSAVIEKIERLYMGNDSSDEEDLPDIPDDQYDTEDSFIDDAELDEYFEVDNSAIKHDGFFVNRGKLERIARNEPPVSPNQPTKKRRRKDIPKNSGENVDGHVSNKHAKVGKTAAGKTASLPVNNKSNSSKKLAVPGEHHEDLKSQNQLEISGINLKKKTADIRPISDSFLCLKVSNNDVPSVVETKDADKQKTGVLQSKNTKDKYKDASAVLDTSQQKFQEKSVYVHSKSQSGRNPSSVDDLKNTGRSKDKNGTHELPDLNLSEGKSVMQTPKSKNLLKKDCSSVASKSTMLEKAIRDLEKTVAVSRPPTMDNQEVDNTSQTIKRRLPREIKLKLAKVARLAASQGKVSTELINRLMSSLGHLIQLRTLKRNLKVMINMGLSAKKEKDDRFQQIKKDVVEMIKIEAPSMESEEQAGASGDQELGPDGKAISKRTFSMDTALEEKICDLYDLFVDGLDETAGPQIRKLYAELAELWPKGNMDNHGIKRAICRAKERRRALHNRNKDQEKIKRKKLLTPKHEENVQFDASSQQNVQKRLAPESSSHPSLNKAVSNTVADVRVLHPPVNGSKKEKVKGSSSCSPADVRVADGALIKKKEKKRKTEHELEGTRFRPEKLASLQEKESPRSLKQSPGVPPKSNLHPTSLPGLEQSS